MYIFFCVLSSNIWLDSDEIHEQNTIFRDWLVHSVCHAVKLCDSDVHLPYFLQYRTFVFCDSDVIYVQILETEFYYECSTGFDSFFISLFSLKFISVVQWWHIFETKVFFLDENY